MSGADTAPGRATRGTGGGRASRGSAGRAVVLALAVVGLVVTLALPARAWLAQQAEIADLQAQNAAAQERVDALTLEAERWNDPAYVEAQARDRLQLVMPGEVGLTTIGKDGAPAFTPTPTPSPTASVPPPWFAELWQSLRDADGR